MHCGNESARFRRAVALFALLTAAAAPAANAALPPLTNLQPGADLRIAQTVDVNVVLIGFGALADPDVLLPGLPTWNGVPQANGDGLVFLGQRFDFRYQFVRPPAWFEDAFFGQLRALAVPQPAISIVDGLPPLPVTPAQFFYDFCNVDPVVDPSHGCSLDPGVPRVNRRFVTQNYLIDAVGVEKILSQALPAFAGVDVTRPTIVLINWYGRPDYVDHVYLDPHEPDPETHVARGLYVANELAGYGGTSHADPESCGAGDCMLHRLWFYDVSAGPMARTGGYDLVADVPRFFVGMLDKGAPDYRFHHPADYGTVSGTYRPLTTALTDLALLIGEVFVSGIAYAAPRYPPGLTPPRLPHHLVLDVNRWSFSGQSFAGLLDAPRLLSKMDALPYEFSLQITDRPQGLDSPVGRVWQCSLTSGAFAELGDSCYGNRNGGWAFADLESYFTDHLFQYVSGAPDYEIPIFQFNVTPALAQGFAGVAASNYSGLGMTSTEYPRQRQTFIYTSTTPNVNAIAGHGALLAHEIGHHLGFNHPFNGYRCVNDTCSLLVPYGSLPQTFFSMAGNYVTGRMSYVGVNNDFSRFELDNLQRWLTWQYLDLAGFVAARIGASPRADSVPAALLQADALAGEALAAYQAYDYAQAEERARAAYRTLVVAAGAIHVQLAPSDYHAVRRDPAEINQVLRDVVRDFLGDSHASMSASFSVAGVAGLEGLTASPPAPLTGVVLPAP